MKKLIELFITFTKIGALTFGGGYAMLPVIQKEIVENRKWVTDEEVLEFYAIGQCTPGIIAANTSTFVGHRIAGIAGGIIATLGFVFPSFFIICIIAGLIDNFADLMIVKNAFAGIRVCACVLIFNAIIKMWKNSVNDLFTFLIFSAVFLLSVFFSLSPVILVLTAGFLGLAGGILLSRAGSPYAEKFMGRKPDPDIETGTGVLNASSENEVHTGPVTETDDKSERKKAEK